MADFKSLFKKVTDKALSVSEDLAHQAKEVSVDLMEKAKVVGDELKEKGSAYYEIHKDEIEATTTKGADILEGLAMIGAEYVQKKIEKTDGIAELKKAAQLISDKTKKEPVLEEAKADEPK